MLETIDISGIGSQMQGVGRLRDGRVAFVPFVLPGERVHAEFEDAASGRFVWGVYREVPSAAPERVRPDCPYYGTCGGCQTRHMTYAASLRFKRQIVTDALTRIGGFDDVQVRETIAPDNPLRARNKAEYPISGETIGAYAEKSHRILPLEDCLLQAEASALALRETARALHEGRLGREMRFLVTRVSCRGEMMLTLSGMSAQPAGMRFLSELSGVKSVWYCRLAQRPKHALDGVCTHVSGERTLTETLLGLRFSVSPQSFFQVNAQQAERLYGAALEAAGLSEPGEKRVLDAYCGAGTITLAAAGRCREALGVEIVPQAVRDAKENARANGLSDRARFLTGDAAQVIPRRISAGERFDAILLDPPRRGAEEALLTAIADARPERIAYVSCDPGTLARDLKRLAARGYRIAWAQPVDMFPFTSHVETVAAMVRT